MKLATFTWPTILVAKSLSRRTTLTKLAHTLTK